MYKKLAIGIISILFLMTGCTNLGGSSTTSSPMSQEKIAAAVNINEEIFGIGSAPVEESGQGVAKMRANLAAREDIKAKIASETKNVLTAYLIEIDFYSKKISDNVISDLSDYITNNMLNETVEKDMWIENNRVYTVVAIEKDDIPIHSRNTFISHIDSIVDKLTRLKNEVLAIPIQEKETIASKSPSVVKEVQKAEPIKEDSVDTLPSDEDTSSLSDSNSDIIDVQL